MTFAQTGLARTPEPPYVAVVFSSVRTEGDHGYAVMSRRMEELGYDRTFTDRVSFSYYEGGHMMYTRPSAHKALKSDVAKFITANEAARPRITTQQQ